MTKVSEVVRVLEQLAPPAYQESYDNVGLQTGNPEDQVSGVLVTLDCTPEVVQEAIDRECNLIVAHHPVIFKALRQLTGRNTVEKTIIEAIRKGIGIYACHTNLDHVQHGVNAKISQKLGLTRTKVLAPKAQTLTKLVTFCPPENTAQVLLALHQAGAGHIGEYADCSFRMRGTGRFTPSESANPHLGKQGKPEEVQEDRIEVLLPDYLQHQVLRALQEAHPYEEVAYYLTSLQNLNQEVGAGMVGELAAPMEEQEFLEYLKQAMHLTQVRHTPFIGKAVERVAVCGGAGSFLTAQAIRAGADVLVTADLKYHEFFAAEGKIVLADIGHYESEVFTKEIFFEEISKNFPNFAVYLSQVNTNPVRYS
ncbi:Nif3-like dinuclear metal center hexameric protein [soil metagenome]